MHLRLLGPVELVGSRGAVSPGGPKERALLAHLGLRPSSVTSEDALVDALWPHAPPRTARRTLQAYLSRLRKAIDGSGASAEVVLEAVPGGWVLRVDADDIDVGRATRLLEAARSANLAGDWMGGVLAASDALSCWRGRALDEFGDLPWAVAEGRRLEELRLQVIEERIDAELGAGRHSAVIAELEPLCADHPLRERLWEQRMLALYRAGQQAEALRTYQDLRRSLVEELGIDPSPALARLEQRILEQDPSLETGPLRDTTAPDRRPGVSRPLPAALDPLQEDRFVGREHELAELDAAWERAQQGSLEVVLLGGEPGIGKTTLAVHHAARVSATGATVLFGRCDEESLAPFQPFMEALGHHIATTAPAALREQLGAQAADLALLLPELSRQLPEAAVTATGLETERYRIFEAVPALLRSMAREAPVVFVLDDLHWADRPTLQLLQHVVRRTTGTRLLVVGTYRDTDLVRSHPLADALADMRRANLVVRLPVRGLHRADVVALVTGGQEPTPADGVLAEALWDDTEGNPLFLREVLRHLAETGLLLQDGGRWTALRRIEQLGIPEGVREVIGRRLTRLTEPTNLVLRNGSVLGRELRVDVLERLTGMDPDAVLDAVDEAVAAGVLDEVPGAAGRYAFTHALVRQALYDELSLTRRVRLHQRAGEALEVIHGDGDGPHLAELAHHFAQAAVAGQADKALSYGRRAARHATATVAYEEAARHLATALEVAEDSGEDEAVRADLLLEMVECHWLTGDARSARSAVERALLLIRPDDAERLARAALGHAGSRVRVVWVDMGRADPRSIELLEQAAAALPGHDSGLRAHVLAALAAEIHYDLDSEDRRLALSEEAIEMARRLGDDRTLVSVLCSSALAIYGPDTARRRRDMAAEAVGLAEALGDRQLLGQAELQVFHATAETGDIPDALSHLRGGMQVLSDLRDPLGRYLLPCYEGGLTTLEGRLVEAEALAHEGFRLGQDLDDRNALVAFGGQMVVLRLHQGRTAELSGLLRYVGDVYPGIMGSIHAMEAMSAAEGGYVDVARHALDLVDPSDRRSLRPDAFWSFSVANLARVCWRLGDVERAGTLLELMQPHADQFAGIATVGWGTLRLPLAWCAALVGRDDEAWEHLGIALEHAQGLGWRTVMTEVRLHQAFVLARRGRPGDVEAVATLLDEVEAAIAELGLVGHLDDVDALRRFLTGAATLPPVGGPPRVRRRPRARGRMVERGRAFVAWWTRGDTDEELERRFGPPVAQRALFTAMTAAFRPEMAFGFTGDIEVELQTGIGDADPESADWWTLELGEQTATARRGRSTSPAATIHVTLPDFVRLCSGELHPVRALVDGQLEIDGQVILAARLADLFGATNPADPPGRP